MNNVDGKTGHITSNRNKLFLCLCPVIEYEPYLKYFTLTIYCLILKNTMKFFLPVVCILIICGCVKNNPAPNSKLLGAFTVSVSNRTAGSAVLQWTPATNPNNSDIVKYSIILNGIKINNGLTVTTCTLSGLTASSYNGVIKAYTQSGDSASANFIIIAYSSSAPSYNYISGYYKVTETTKVLSSGVISNYVFYASVSLINDSTIQFTQNRRKPVTWWTCDFPTQVYPLQADTLIGSGITPRGRILNPTTIRMGYIFGSTLVYDVRQLWEKLANPADTSNINYNYPSLPGMITTVAGNNTSGTGSGSSGDGGPAIAAALANPYDVVADNIGNIYLIDGFSTYSIRKVSSAGIITRYAGNNTSGFSGDGGPATSAQLNSPWGLALDVSGNLYITDAGNRVIRKVSTTGTISTIAGIPGSFGYSGDGGPATSALLGAPAGIAIDAAGNVFFADPGMHVVRKIAVNGIITTVAGTGGTGGFSGDGGTATAAHLHTPWDVCVDASGNLYIADKDNHVIRKVNGSGIITTVAGTAGVNGFSGDGSSAVTAKLDNPQSVSVDASGNLYISDYGNNRIRKVNSTGTISTIAGNGQVLVMGDGPDFYGGDYGPATSASVYAPYGNFQVNNFLFVATTNRIRKIILP